jgi:ATP-binding cassette subfamily F protein 3
MVMDEPTNHLDLMSSEILTDALVDYTGTLIFVSHNQAFVNRLATKIWDIREEMIEEYPGSLDEYYDHLDRISKHLPLEPDKKQVHESPPKEKKSRKDQKKTEAEKRRLVRSTLKPIQDKLTLIEQRITNLEQKKEDLEKLLSDPDVFTDKGKSVPLLDEYSEVREKIEELMARWEYGQDQLESARKNLGIEKK